MKTQTLQRNDSTQNELAQAKALIQRILKEKKLRLARTAMSGQLFGFNRSIARPSS